MRQRLGKRGLQATLCLLPACASQGYPYKSRLVQQLGYNARDLCACSAYTTLLWSGRVPPRPTPVARESAAPRPREEGPIKMGRLRRILLGGDATAPVALICHSHPYVGKYVVQSLLAAAYRICRRLASLYSNG